MEQPFEYQTSEWPDSYSSESPQSARKFNAVPVAAWRSRAANVTAEEEQMDRDRSIIAQNAGTTAAAIYNAVHGDGPWDPEAYDAIRLHVFNGTLELAGAGMVVEQFTSTHPAEAGTTVTTPPQQYSGNGGGSNDNGAGVELKFGKYKGKTIGQVAESEDGRSWLNWAAASSNNDFIKAKAQEFLAANGLLETANN